ncbi:M14 family zinc carboxypeptidase [Stutzerimonas chloritidismutans]|nr:M14 family zinc carboxypeptidase [Stutzerimonas chloritidismutans]
MSNNQLYDQLNALSRRFPDALRLEQAGSSNEGRPIWLARLSNSDKPAVMITTQQHGNEPHGTEAAVNLIKRLASGGALSRQVLDNLQVADRAEGQPGRRRAFQSRQHGFQRPANQR